MRAIWVVLGVALVASAIAQQSTPTAEIPAWAFPSPKTFSAPGSTRRYAEVVLFDRTRAVDWFPDDHPAMPDAVKGRTPMYACGYCHLPSGGGRPENAALAGLPEAYLARQLGEMRNGTRAYDPHFTTGINMVLVATMSSADDLRDAARYFSSLKYQKHLRVIEAATIPRAITNSVYFFDRSGATEPLGERIIEGPDDAERFEQRDPNLGYTAYVPPGSIARGAALARGAADRPACDTCHGAGLKGSDIGPPLAGRFATGLFRQLYDFRSGLRDGAQGILMRPVVARMSNDDMIALAAYAASLEP